MDVSDNRERVPSRTCGMKKKRSSIVDRKRTHFILAFPGTAMTEIDFLSFKMKPVFVMGRYEIFACCYFTK